MIFKSGNASRAHSPYFQYVWQDHITALAQTVRLMDVPEVSNKKKRVVASERKIQEIELDGGFLVVGERINPTGKKKLQEQLRQDNLDLVIQMAEEQEEKGAAILDINVGMNGIDEDAMMQKVLYEVTGTVNLPLCIDSSYVEEHALRIYPGRALINSISLEKEKFEKLMPIARKYGAMFILLPLSDEGLPKNIEEKQKIIHTIYDRAMELGFTKEDIVVDGLVATVGANRNAAIETMETITYCKEEMQLATICGLSNISFGLPERGFVNTAFLTMAISKGLTMAIANPSQDLLMNAAYASDLLLNKEGSDVRYIENVKSLSMTSGNSVPATKQEDKKTQENAGNTEHSKLYENVLKGNKRTMVDDVKAFLAAGNAPQSVIEEHLIPAINEVGVLFDRKKYFLPQLISSAEAMETAISYVEPMLPKAESGEDTATIVVATVEGDIHDIGKNIVKVLLENYGYDVIDLGKDVEYQAVVDAVRESGAKLVGLSALMTTTLVSMEETIKLIHENNLDCKIMVGGAVLTPEYAEQIHADFYAKDAKESVDIAKRVIG